MLARGIEARLRKLEGRRRIKETPWFLIWGRTPADIQAVEEATRNSTNVTRLAQSCRVPWPFKEAPPTPHWIFSVRDFSDRELEAMLAIAKVDGTRRCHGNLTNAQLEQGGARSGGGGRGAARHAPPPPGTGAEFGGR